MGDVEWASRVMSNEMSFVGAADHLSTAGICTLEID